MCGGEEMSNGRGEVVQVVQVVVVLVYMVLFNFWTDCGRGSDMRGDFLYVAFTEYDNSR